LNRCYAPWKTKNHIMSRRLWTIVDWNEQAREAKFCFKELARLHDIPARTLHRFLSERFDCRPREWLGEVRMEWAADMLAKGKPVSEVATKSGYGGVSQFSRAFRAYYGYAPRAHLKRMAGGSA
jgi:transcriptional regulator GlxA family with amidase domain